ncbi:hypothetical protein ACP4OV_016830 [Aristida adscensionis]
MRTRPAALSLLLALSASLLAASVAAGGYGGGDTGSHGASPAPNGYGGGGAPAAPKNGDSGSHGGSPAPNGYGGGAPAAPQNGDGGSHGASPAPNGYGGGAPAAPKGYGGSHGGSPAPNGYGGGAPAAPHGGGGGKDDGDSRPAYEKPEEGLDAGYYDKSCPGMEAVVQKAVKKAIDADYTLAPGLIRLFFHDFAVRGTDGSVLVDEPGRSERYAEASKTLRGFELIEAIKKELEAKCPRTVSCADILTAAARDAAVAAKAPYWPLKYGRKDGGESRKEEADRYVPMGRESVTDLIQFFESKGLDILDLVVLSGAHTIGRATCGAVRPGLHGRRQNGTLDRRYGDFLRRKCRAGGDGEHVELDGETPTAFDNQYYKNLLRKMGVLPTDQKLLPDSRTGSFVHFFGHAAPGVFAHQFARSMTRLSEKQVLTGDEGNVRIKCSAFN